LHDFASKISKILPDMTTPGLHSRTHSCKHAHPGAGTHGIGTLCPGKKSGALAVPPAEKIFWHCHCLTALISACLENRQITGFGIFNPGKYPRCCWV